MYSEEILDGLETRLNNLYEALDELLYVVQRAEKMSDLNIAAGLCRENLSPSPPWKDAA